MKTLAKILGGVVGLTLSLLPMRMNAQDLSNPILNPFMQPRNTTIYYGSGDVDSSGVVDESDYQAMQAGVQNDMADLDGDEESSTTNDLNIMREYLDGVREYLPGQRNRLQTSEERGNFEGSIMRIDNGNDHSYIPGEYISGEFADELYMRGFGAPKGFVPSRYDSTQFGRYNIPIYNITVLSNISPWGHGMNAILDGDNPLNFEGWNFIEPQTDSTNVQPGEWDIPYDSKIWISGIERFSEITENDIPYTVLGFNIDENGNDSLIYQDPNLITKRPAMPRENLIAEMNEEGIYQIPKRQLVWHLNDSLEFRILTSDNVDVSFNDSIMVLTGLENYFGSANVSWDVYNGQVTENGNLEVIINNVPDAPMVSVRDTSTTQRGRFDLIGEGSDPNGDIASYSWEQLSGPAVIVRDSDKSTANFDLQEEGVYNFKYTVTDSTGLYDLDTLTVDASVLGVNNIVNLPREYSLGNNYPNPFNPSTTIEYSIPTGGKVSLEVYDLGGRKVRTLVDEIKNPGEYEVNWNGRNEFGDKLPSGIYIYRMSAEGFSKSEKMVLLK